MRNHLLSRACVLSTLLACDPAPDKPARVPDTAPPAPPCSGEPGRFSDQQLQVDGEVRGYFLYVPAQYDCTAPMPVLLDFHGTSAARSADATAEEDYALDALISLADDEGVIVIRPRSLTWESGDQHIFQWDASPGDLEKNTALSVALLDTLGASYNLGALYVSGFSNGTNMAAQLMAEGLPEAAGFGFVGGGLWDAPAPRALDSARVWSLTGYRDYMQPWQRQLERALDDAGHPAAQRLWREADAGHDLYGWHYRDMWAFLSAGTRPAEDTPEPPWTVEDIDTTASLLEVAAAGDGSLVAVGDDGTIAWRDPSGAWSVLSAVTAGALVGVCITGGGVALAVGEGDVVTADRSSAEARPDIADFGGYWGGPAWMNDVACAADGQAIAVGYWNAATSLDRGESWDGVLLETAWDGLGQGAAVAVSDEGTWIAAGYYTLGRSTDGETFAPIQSPWSIDWINAVAVGDDHRWWLAGDAGSVSVSDDDGLTWDDVSVPWAEEDWYTVAVGPEGRVLVAGARGAVAVSEDGGESWTDRSLAADRFLGGAAWLDAETAVVVGEAGAALRLSLDPSR